MSKVLQNERLEISREEYKGKRIAFLYGDGTEPFPQLGNVVYHNENNGMKTNRR